MKRLRVYLSSTFEDLKAYRVAVFDALEKAGLDVARMEAYTAADERPLDLCLRDVANSDILVGIYAWRYGYEPPEDHGNPEGRSITELEYRQAERSGLRKLVFLAHPDTEEEWDPRFRDSSTGAGENGSKLRRSRDELSAERTASFFRTPAELAMLVLAAIMRGGLGGRPYNIRARPPGLIPRPALTKALVDAVVGSASAGGRHALLQGAGGLGKTTIALDCCHQAEVVNAFPDGLMWITLGEKPNLEQVLHELHVLTTGDPPVVQGTDAIGDAVAKALEGRPCLVVIDDAWRAEDLSPFLHLDGPRLLVTTRLQTLIEEAGQIDWFELPVDEMPLDEAVALLGRGLPIEEPVSTALSGLAVRLGCWPLLLELANARIREEHKKRGNLARCVDLVTALLERRGVLSFDRQRPGDRNAAVANSVAVGLEFAEHLLPGLGSKSAEISVFPENVAIPVQALSDLWNMEAPDVEEEVLRRLDNLSLVRWNRDGETIRLHMMVHRALAARLATEGGPIAVHRRLVECWRDPYHLPHDYAWRWFGWHCMQGQQGPRLQRLLLDFGWLQRKLDATDVNALLGEFDRAHSEPPLAALRRALRGAAHVLARRPAELATQLFGRVPEVERPGLQEFFVGAQASAPRPWLRPLTASLADPALLRVIRAEGGLSAVAVSRDGRRIVSVSEDDDTHTVWDVDAGVPLRSAQWHIGRPTSLMIGVTGPSEATTTSAHGSVTWDLETGELLQKNGSDHSSELPTLVPENKWDVVKWWSRVPGEPLWVAITARLLPAGQSLHTVYLCGADRTARVAARFGDRGSLTGAAVAAKGLRLITCSGPDLGAVVWDLESGEKLCTIPGGNVRVVGCDREGEFVVTGTNEGVISLWGLDALVDGSRDSAPHTGPVADAKVSGDQRLGFTASRDGTANAWDLQTGTVVTHIAPHASSAEDVFWDVLNVRVDSDKGQVDFLTSDADFRHGPPPELSSYDLATGALVAPPVLPSKDGLSGSSPDYRALFDKSVVDLGESIASHSTTPLCRSPDGSSGVTASDDHAIWLWDLSTGTRIATFGVDSPPKCCACTTGAETLIVGEENGRVHILRLEEQAE